MTTIFMPALGHAGAGAAIVPESGIDRDTAIATLKPQEAELRQLGVAHLFLFGATTPSSSDASNVAETTRCKAMRLC
jgi:hypothetical protein